MHHSQESQTIGQQIMEVILTHQEPQSLLEQMALTIGKFFQADFCLLISHSSEEIESVKGCWTSNYELNQPLIIAQLLSHQSIKQIFVGQEIDSVFEINTTHQDDSQCLPWESMLVMTCHSPHNQGFIFIGHNQYFRWDQGYKNLVQSLRQSFASSFTQVKFQQQAQRRLRYQVLLHELGEEIATSSEVEQIWQIGLSKTVQALQADGGLALNIKYDNPLYVHQSNNKIPKGKFKVICQVSSQEDYAVVKGQTFALSESLVFQKAFQASPQPVAIDNSLSFPTKERDEHHNDLLNLNSSPALLMIPLVGSHSLEGKQGLILGFFVLQQAQPRSWQKEEIELTKCISNQISTAIFQQQTLQRLHLLVDERTAQLKRSLEVQAKLYEKTRQHVEQLRHLNQVKDQFLSTVQDELKHPLTKMKMAIEMLKIAPDSEKRQRHLTILETECMKEIDLVNDLLTLQKLESQQYLSHPEKLNLKLIVDELVPTIEDKWQDKNLSFVVDYSSLTKQSQDGNAPLMLYTDHDSLRRILIELLSNAGKFSIPDSQVNLEVKQLLGSEGEQVVVTLTNLGTPISPEAQKHIFDKFHRGNNANNGTEQGTGLGLALVKCLVEHLNGKIEFNTVPCEDGEMASNCFTVTLPKRLESSV